jgi:hypothetical protein
MQVRTKVKAGGVCVNHNETLTRAEGIRVRSSVKAGGTNLNHTERLVRAHAQLNPGPSGTESVLLGPTPPPPRRSPP